MDDTTPTPPAADATPNPRAITLDATALSRRQLGIAAAWAAPIVAIAATAPLASASIEDEETIMSILTTTSLAGNSQSGSAISGSAGGELQIFNVGGPWTASPVTAQYRLVGPLPHPIALLWEGVEIVEGNTITVGSNTWTVAFYGASGGGTLAYLTLQDPLPVPASGSAFAQTPVLTFATVSTGAASTFNPIRWQLEVGAAAVEGPIGASISDITGKSIPAV